MPLAPVPMSPTTLSASLVMRGSSGTTAGVLVVPARGVERRALERPPCPGMAGSFMRLRIPTAMITVPGADLVAAVGADAPSATRSSSHSARARRRCGTARRRRGRTGRAIASRCWRISSPERVARRRDVVHLLEHRHVDVRLDVAHHARVAVPVPGAADAAGLVDQADAVDARACAAARRRRRRRCRAPMIATSTSSVTGSRSAYRRERILAVLGDAVVVRQVADRRPRRHHALVALGLVLRPDRLRIEVRRLVVGCHHPPPPELQRAAGNRVSAPVMSMRGAR